jgi:indole-3-glycerol phosphate synthase
MPKRLPARISGILRRVNEQIVSSKSRHGTHELRARLEDAPPVRPFAAALEGQFSLIAEIKRKSPSKGPMRHGDIAQIAAIYNEANCVRAVSVLTNEADFGMNVDALTQVKSIVHQPILRKDFIVDEHQVYEARVSGADAILLMASILEKSELRLLADLAHSIGLEVLFEAHTREEIDEFPDTARICGINSRAFSGRAGSFGMSRMLTAIGWRTTDLSTSATTFDLSKYLPKGCIRVAESGIKPGAVKEVRHKFDAILVGTSILMANDVKQALSEFETAIQESAAAETEARMPLSPGAPLLS